LKQETKPEEESAAGTKSKAGEAAKEETPADGKKVQLRIGWWGNAERDKLYYKINDLFMAENPNVEIITSSPGWNDYWVKIATDYASGNAPDIVQFQANQIGEYCPKGVLIPLDPYIDSGVINLDNWNMEFVDTGKYKDKLYMVTIGITAQAMFLNKTWIEELGFEVWDFEKSISWDEFEKLMIDIQKKLPEGTYAGLDFYNNSDLAWIWIRQHSPAGIEWVGKDGKFAPSIETLEGWYALCDRLRKAGAFPPIEWTQEWSARPWQDGAIVSRKVLYRAENANKYKLFTEYAEDDIVIRRVQSDPGALNPNAELLITSAFGISDTSENKDIAAKY
ncbi:MAG: extracellular solute-binding protein, partial [Firmicutes bacterium]|nr:extracellular solute-binding protein [Bacillota bacterium]